jgi:hypothetical protein
MRSFVKHNGLSLLFMSLFVVTLVGQTFAGHADYNHQLVSDGLDPISWTRYVSSSQFMVDVTENWQSEYLQFWLYLTATIWLLQKGSPESKELGTSGVESAKNQKIGTYADEASPALARRTGLLLHLYSRSLGTVMGIFFGLSWLAQSVTGRVAYNADQLAQLQEPVSWLAYVGSADFWNRTLQNWQSEFLAVASLAVLSIYLRERGSPQSKPVGSAHDATGVEG